MSFFGKKYKKAGVENMEELLAAMKSGGEQLRHLLQGPEAMTFNKNADGSIKQTIELPGNKSIDRTVILNKESDLTTPDGEPVTYISSLDGDTWKLTFNVKGLKINMDRVFKDGKCFMYVQAEGCPIKATIIYNQV